MKKLSAILFVVLFANPATADDKTIKFKLWNTYFEITLPNHLCHITSGQLHDNLMTSLKKGVRTQPMAAIQPCDASWPSYEYGC